MYTHKQQSIITHVRDKVKDLFAAQPIRAHGFDHACRVANWAVAIAKDERDNVFLAEVSAWLHDIGRAIEHLPGNTKRHHEYSYDLCRKWFQEDRAFDVLSKTEKLIILYAVRYHWNEAANKYKVAWILRDADKLDTFGAVGLKRIREFYNNNEETILQNLRLLYEMAHNIRSKKARQIMKSGRLFEPIIQYQHRLLKSQIKPVIL